MPLAEQIGAVAAHVVLELIVKRLAGIWEDGGMLRCPSSRRVPSRIVGHVASRLLPLRMRLPVTAEIDEYEGDADYEDLPEIRAILSKTADGRPPGDIECEHHNWNEQQCRRLCTH